MISVLYIDDEPGLLEIGREFLERSNEILVDTALSATDGIKRLDTYSYDAVISDYQMPGIDGIEFLKIVRKTHGDLPFILFTGKGREEVVIEALNEGADSYIQKGGNPVPLFTELEHRVRQAVGQRRAQRGIQESEERYRALFEGANDAIFLMERDEIIDCNNKALELFSLSREELIHTKPVDHSPEFQPGGEPSREKGWEFIQQALDGKPVVFEWRHTRKDSTEFDVEVSLACLNVRGGDLILGIIRDIGERKQMESVLRESARLMTDIISFLPDATFVLNPEGEVISWNRAMEQLTGINAEDMIGKGNYEYALPFYQERRPLLADIILDPENAEIRQKYPALRQEKNNLVAEINLPNFRGRENTYLWFTASPLISSVGTVIGAIESIRDITPHKNREGELVAAYEQVAAMEEELRNNFDELAAREQALSISEERFRSLFSTMEEGGALAEILYDKNGNRFDYRIIEVNSGFERAFGIPCGYAAGKTSRELFDTDEPSALDLYARVAETRIPRTVEVYSDPLKKYLSLSVYSPMKGTFATVFQDITERKNRELELRAAYEQIAAIEEELRNNLEELTKREQALRASEERYRRIVETATEGIWELDTNYVTVLVNPRLAQMLEYSSDEIIGHPYTDYLFEEDLSSHAKMVANRRDGISEGYERRFRKRNGDPIWCFVSTSPIRDSVGNFKGSFAMLTDITARKEAERELMFKFDELNAATEEMGLALEELKTTDETLLARNEELENQKRALALSEETLKITNRKMNLLASVTRHDVINQLMILHGYVELSSENPGPKRLAEIIAKEKSVLERIHHQISFTKEYQEIGVKAPIWQEVSLTISSAGRGLENVKISIDSSIGKLEIFADPLLTKVFYNLFDNTIRYGEHATIITISCQKRDSALILKIADNGVGIPAADKKKIFEKGFGKNTGFGLFLASEILQITGLAITETGLPGKGAHFEIMVPEGSFRFTQ